MTWVQPESLLQQIAEIESGAEEKKENKMALMAFQWGSQALSSSIGCCQTARKEGTAKPALHAVTQVWSATAGFCIAGKGTTGSCKAPMCIDEGTQRVMMQAAEHTSWRLAIESSTAPEVRTPQGVTPCRAITIIRWPPQRCRLPQQLPRRVHTKRSLTGPEVAPTPTWTAAARCLRTGLCFSDLSDVLKAPACDYTR